MPEPVLNKRAVESLIKAGAFDSLGHTRKGLLGVFEHVTDVTLDPPARARAGRDEPVRRLGRAEADDVAAGFDERLPIPDVEFEKVDKLRHEKEMLGPVRVGPPAVRRRGGAAAQGRARRSSMLAELDDGATVQVGGVVTGLDAEVHQARRPDGGVRARGPRVERSRSRCSRARSSSTATSSSDDVIVAVKGRLDRRDESRVNLICQSIEVLSGLQPSAAPPLRLRIPSTSLDELSIQRLKRILRDHPGDSVVTLDIGTQVLRLSDEFRVDLDLVVGELRMAFGHDAVVL